MAEVTTYSSLLDDVVSYAERENSPEFIAQVPRFLALAENRIAAEVRGLGFKRFVTGTFSVGQPVLAKPTRWRETVSWNYGRGGTTLNNRTTIFPRSYEYCRLYWPDPNVTGTPRFYADYDYEHFLVVGTPDLEYPFELVYHERPEPLDATHQESWTTRYAPQLLLFATLLEAQPWLKSDERLQVWQAAYDRAMAAISGEDKSRAAGDHSTVRKSA